MKKKPSSVGNNIRNARAMRGLTIRDIAQRVGCSESVISKIETGNANPSLSMLNRICDSLHITVASLFDSAGGTKIVSRSGERENLPIDSLGSYVERLVPMDGQRLLEGHLHVVEPGGGSEGVYSHEGEEVGFVIEGTIELVVGNERFQLSTGDSFSFSSRLPHSYKNIQDSIARVVWVSTPSRPVDDPESFDSRNLRRKRQ